jgi:hypothetical protein
MKSAEARVTAFAHQLEDASAAPVSPSASVLPRGKVERYLALFRPWHFELLTRIVKAMKKT